MILPPYPFSLEDPSDMSLEDAWHARPQLFFKCIFRPRDGRPPKNASWTRGHNDMEVCLVFFSTFEELKLPATGPMDRASATTKLYEESPTPILCVASCDLIWAGCHCQCFPVSWKATLLSPYLTSCGTSRAALSSTGPPTQPPLMAVGGATCTRSFHGCGRLAVWAREASPGGSVRV